jgi:hypothetical protein
MMSPMALLERFARLFRRPCSRCHERALRTRNWIRATLVNDRGERYPDSWSYESCDACGARTKRYHNGRTETPSEQEWQQQVVGPEERERRR